MLECLTIMNAFITVIDSHGYAKNIKSSELIKNLSNIKVTGDFA